MPGIGEGVAVLFRHKPGIKEFWNVQEFCPILVWAIHLGLALN